MQTLYDILMLLLRVAQYFVIAHIIMSWLIQFQVLNVRQQLVGRLWYGLQQLLEPIYDRVRRYLPNLGGIDLAPLVVLLAIIAVQTVLVNNRNLFG